MIAPVIVGVEGSDRSRDPLALGQRLATGLGAELIAAYVCPFGELGDRFAGGSSTEALQLMDEVADANHAFVRDLTTEQNIGDVRLTSASSAAEGLAMLAEETDAGLVVLGSSNRAGVERVAPGGTGGTSRPRPAAVKAHMRPAAPDHHVGGGRDHGQANSP